MTFFGPSPEDRFALFSEIHEIVFFGNGGYSWLDVYEMPIWLRKYTFGAMKEWYKKQEPEDLNDATNTKKEIYKPNIAPKSPTYTVPAPKK